MMSPIGAVKTCVVCGQDCSNRPRTKDQRGRYFCAPCYETAVKRTAEKKAQARNGPASVAALAPQLLEPDDAGIFDRLLAEVAVPAANAGAHACPGCGAAMQDGSVLCTSCGYNVQTGQKLHVQTIAAPRERRDFSGSAGAIFNPMTVGLAALAIYAVLALTAGQSGGQSGALAFAAWHVPFALVTSIFVLVLAFRESIAQGFLSLCVPCYVIYFVYGVSDNNWARWLFSVYLVGHVLWLVLFRTTFIDAAQAY